MSFLAKQLTDHLLIVAFDLSLNLKTLEIHIHTKINIKISIKIKMSDNIPFEIQSEIMKKLPVKSLIQFRSVCKSWKSLIDTSDFIANYSGQHTQPPRLLVRYEDSVKFGRKYVSILDDDNFPQHKVPITVPLLVNLLKYPEIIGSSHGLLCMYGEYRKCRGESPVSGTLRAVIWNPSIRKSVDVIVPNVAVALYVTILGFGVCGETKDPKIVKIIQTDRESHLASITCIPRRVELFTLSTGVWRSPYSSNLPRTSIQLGHPNVVINGFIYWLATERITVGGGSRSCNMVISFDLTSEEFKEIKLPDRLVYRKSYKNLSLYKLGESLVVLERGVEASGLGFVVWMMEDGVPNLFTKVFTVNTPHPTIWGFRKTGEPIIEIVKDLGINGLELSFSVHPFMETLLLLDQPEFIVYEKDKHYIAKWRTKNRRLLQQTSKV